MKRQAFLAGSWYPKDERRCREAISRHAEGTAPEPGPWHGLIGPHAGWAYSGDTAAALRDVKNGNSLIVEMAPSGAS